MMPLSISLLGGFQARLDRSAVALPTRKAQALLAYLALPPGRSHPRDKLAALLWGGIRDESARASLRQALFSIRKAVGEKVLSLAASAVALDPTAVDVDVDVFTRAVADGSPEALTRAVELYHGDLLAGLVVDEAAWEEWLVGERERLRELALEAMARLLAHQRRSGPVEPAVATALKLLTLDPLQEAVHRALMRLYTDVGRRGAALRQYQQCVNALQRELGVEPEAETKQLYEEVLRGPGRRSGAATAAVTTKSRTVLRTVSPSVRTSTPFVGRAAEVTELVGTLERAMAGRGGVVAVLGEAGVGKSRVVSELAVTAITRRVSVLTGRAYESEQILAFGPWVDALRAARIANDAALLERLEPGWRAELARLLPELGAAATTPVEARRLFEAVAAVLAHLAAAAPLLLILEDLHWADEMTARLLAFVGRRVDDRAVVLVVTARADELEDAPALRGTLEELARDGRLATIALAPLSRTDTDALARSLARAGSDDRVVSRLCDHVWAVSEGNPFVAVEAVLASGEGSATVSRTLAVPERVRDIIGRRLARLSERGRTLAEVAAVIGREFDFRLLQRAGAMEEAEAASGVEELVRRGVLHDVGERFDFTHDRIREVAYGTLIGPRRQLLHRRVAEALEELHRDDLRPHMLALGLHYREAGVWPKSLDYLERAGREAQTVRSANREAIACYDGALAALSRLPDNAERSKRAIDLLIYVETALMGLGDFHAALRRLREAEALAGALAERSYIGRVQSRLTYHLASIGDFEGAVAAGEKALALEDDQPDARLRAGVRVVVARAHYGLGDFRRALEVARRNESLAALQTDPRLADRVVGFSSVWAILALAELGQFRAADDLAARAIRSAEEEAGPHGKVWGHLGVGRMLVVQGDVPRAVATLEPTLSLCEVGSDLAVYFSRTASSLGLAFALGGRVAEGLALLERAAEHAATIDFAYGRALVVGMLGEAHVLAGDVDEAARRGVEALDLARKYRQRGWEAWALGVLGDVALVQGESTEAHARFRDAIALADPRGMRPLLAHCRRGLGHVHRIRQEADAAREHMDIALAEYRAMQMPYWIARAELELATFT